MFGSSPEIAGISGRVLRDVPTQLIGGLDPENQQTAELSDPGCNPVLDEGDLGPDPYQSLPPNTDPQGTSPSGGYASP